ncbi:MAG TPA: DUF5060 domain-containing protein [Planctomycetota bacterium]|nr:DUF5060 domain-containing protein [Planctomycetota bacterium]
MFLRHCMILCAAVCLQIQAATITGVQVLSPTTPAGQTPVVPQFSKFEIKVSLTTASTKFYEIRPSSGGVDMYATFTNGTKSIKAFGFYDGSSWKIRFAPTLTGTWTYRVTAQDSKSTSNSATFSLNCTASSDPGFAQISGQFLKFSNGATTFFTGQNNGWQYDLEQPSFSTMKSCGLNVMSFWMNSPWITPTETDPVKRRRVPIENVTNGVGKYNQEACAYIDGLVERAEAAGVYLLPSIWSHGNCRDTGHPWGQGWWYNSAYKSVCTAIDFFKTTSANKDTAQWALQKNYYRYIIARWGYSRAVVGFVSMVELDGTTGYYRNSTQAVNWTVAVRNYFAANDPYRTNSLGKHPIGASKTDWDGTATNWNGGDLFGIDSYRDQFNDTEVASRLAGQTASMRAHSTLRPAFHFEFGGDCLTAEEAAQNPLPAHATQPLHLHNGLWAATAAGACVSPLVWCDGGHFPMLTDAVVGEQMISELQKLSSFMSGLSYYGSATYAPRSVSSASARGWSMGAGSEGFAWVQTTSGTMSGKSFTINSVAAGTYTVLWFNPWSSTSTPLHSETLTTAAGLSLTAPTVSRGDVLCKYFPNSAPVLSGATATPNPVTGTTTVPAANASDDADASGLVYTWSVIGTPPAPVTFSANGSNAAQNAMATFTKAGVYEFRVVVADAGGATSSVASVTVTVEQTPVVTLNPASATVETGATAQFAADIKDQFGAEVPGATLSWTATGGTIDAGGLYTAGSTAGTFSVTATYSLPDNRTAFEAATVSIVEPPAPDPQPASGDF